MAEKSELKIPTHIGFIMDGNRRWARENKKGVPISGTAYGAKTLERIVELSVERGIKYITVYAFSKENWERSKEEVDYLLNLLVKKVPSLTKKVHKNGIKIKIAGRIKDFPPKAQKVIMDAIKKTKNNTKATLNIAASYGGKQEIIDIVKKIINDKVKIEDVTEELFNKYIYEAGQPDLDLIVRTSGVKRLSGFMLWQSTYSELYFTDTLWPDFDESELNKALIYYKNVKRNFGK